MSKLNEVLNGLKGDRESFRELLLNKDRLLSKVCDYAKHVADRRRLDPWSVMSDIFGHGSGVSSALFELYRDAGDDVKPVNMTVEERRARTLTADLWNAFLALPDSDDDSIRAVRDAIHVIQGELALRVARRVDKDIWR